MHNNRSISKSKGSVVRSALWIFISFFIGYFCATTLNLQQLGSWLNTQWIAKHEQVLPTKKTTTTAMLPKPKFEFYTLLSSEQQAHKAHSQESETIANSAVQKITASSPVSVVGKTNIHRSQESAKEFYFLQVAAFKKIQDAERLKASLILKGYEVSIAPAQDMQGWHRVVMGPYTQQQAEKTRGLIAQNERLNGIVRRSN